MSKALKHYIVYSGSSGWSHSENLSVQEWVNKIDHNMNSLCQLERGAHIRYSVNLVVCAKVGGSGAIPPMLSNSTSPQVLIDTVKGVTINIVTSPVYDRANVDARFKSQIWVMHRKLRVVAVIWQFRIQVLLTERVAGRLRGGPCSCQKVISVHSVHSAWVPRTAVPNHDLAGQEQSVMNELYGCDSEWRAENRWKPLNRAPEWRLLLFSNSRKLPCCATRSVCAARCASRGNFFFFFFFTILVLVLVRSNLTLLLLGALSLSQVNSLSPGRFQ